MTQPVRPTTKANSPTQKTPDGMEHDAKAQGANSTVNTNITSTPAKASLHTNTTTNAEAAKPPKAPSAPADAAQADSVPELSKPAASKTAQPKNLTMKNVPIVIAGHTYSIHCPSDEEAELHAASDFINEFISSIRKQAPQLSHENLLVLCCLNLYEQLQQHRQQEDTHSKENAQAQALLDKILQDAKALL